MKYKFFFQFPQHFTLLDVLSSLSLLLENPLSLPLITFKKKFFFFRKCQVIRNYLGNPSLKSNFRKVCYQINFHSLMLMGSDKIYDKYIEESNRKLKRKKKRACTGRKCNKQHLEPLLLKRYFIHCKNENFLSNPKEIPIEKY